MGTVCMNSKTELAHIYLAHLITLQMIETFRLNNIKYEDLNLDNVRFEVGMYVKNLKSIIVNVDYSIIIDKVIRNLSDVEAERKAGNLSKRGSFSYSWCSGKIN